MVNMFGCFTHQMRVIPISSRLIHDGVPGLPGVTIFNSLMRAPIHSCWQMYAMPMGSRRLTQLIGHIDDNLVAFVHEQRGTKNIAVIRKCSGLFPGDKNHGASSHS